MMKRIGLMGGTFDPIHHGHLAAAEEVRFSCQLDEIIFIPAGQPPHKKGASVDAQDRLAMVKLAIANNPFFSASDYETNKSGPSYSILTVDYFLDLLGPNVELFFITGADAILLITTWLRYRELLSRCNFIAMTRPGYSLTEFFQQVPELEPMKDRFRFIQVPALSISSTDIRQRVRSRQPIKYLVPEAVENYIQLHGLYC